MNQPAGWYPDPQRTGEQRYWNGAAWTEHRAAAAIQFAIQPGAVTAPAGAVLGDKSPGLAGFLSFLISGLGQLYAGDVGRGLAWFFGMLGGWIVTWFLSIVSLGLLGLVLFPVMIGLYIWCIIDAASTTNKANYVLRSSQPIALTGPVAQGPYPGPQQPGRPALPPTSEPGAYN